MVKRQRYAVFYGEFENGKKKRTKKIEPQIFNNFCRP